MGNQNIRLYNKNNIINPSDIIIDEIIKHTNNNIEIKASSRVIEKLKIYSINEDRYFFIILTQYPHIAFSWLEPGYDTINDLINGKHNAKYRIRITGPKYVPNISFFFFKSIVLVQYIVEGNFKEGVSFSPQWNTNSIMLIAE
jgi:hypothetical protein